jgi:hypothetical protein
MWVYFLQAVATLIVSYALQSLTKPKATVPEAGQLDVPKAKEGDNIPVCFGTVIFKEMNVIWYGGARIVPILEKPQKK